MKIMRVCVSEYRFQLGSAKWESDWGAPLEEAKRKGFYRADVEAKQGSYLIGHILSLTYLKKHSWLFVIGCS